MDLEFNVAVGEAFLRLCEAYDMLERCSSADLIEVHWMLNERLPVVEGHPLSEERGKAETVRAMFEAYKKGRWR